MSTPFFKTRISMETGVPPELLTGDDVKTCEQQARELLEWASKGPMEEPEHLYPDTGDSGEPVGLPPDFRPAREQFEDWFRETTAFNPRKRPGGWVRIV